MAVCVVGLGKIGLPLAVHIAGRRMQVVGLDVSDVTVASVMSGEAPFPGEPHLQDRLATEVAAGRLRATTDAAEAVPSATAVIMVVPLPVDHDKRPDYRMLDAATDAVAPHLQRDVLVSYETTLPVGATRDRFLPRLAAGSGLIVGDTLFVCHSPERVASGRVFRDLRTYPKLVGGVDSASAERAVDFYSRVLQFDARPDLPRPNGVWDLGSAEAAELAKLAETTYRDVNIAFANELAFAAEGLGLDIRQVIDACNSQPFSHIHTPGFVGGHCIPVYPHLLMGSVDGFRLPALARDVNESVAGHAVRRLLSVAGPLTGRRVAVLGLAFRGGVKEDAVSGAYRIAYELRVVGAIPVVSDPMYSGSEIMARGLDPYTLGEQCDALIVQTDHPEYAQLRPEDVPGVTAVVDLRGVLSSAAWADIDVLQLGVG